VTGIQNTFWLLLAETAKKADGAADPAPAPGLQNMLPAIAVIMVLFYFLILRPQKNKDQQQRSMLDSLKETDRVITIGGIHGVVSNVNRETGIVTVRIDEATGAKIRVGTSAIATVVTDSEKAE
jgi:preprotein translocase subunit YajC